MSRIIDPFSQFLDDNGDPLINGKLKFLESGTNNTDKNTYADINETIANSNPVILDAAGRCPNVFGSGTYNVISYSSDDVQFQQFDPVSSELLEGDFSSWNAASIYDLGDIVTGSVGLYYRSLVNNNQNQDPSISPSEWEEIQFLEIWNTNVAYGIGDIVNGSDGQLYSSRTASNTGNNPTTGDTNWKLLNDSSEMLNNSSFTATIASKAITFALKANNSSDPSSTNKAMIAFRSATLTSGLYEVKSATAAASIVVPDGATLGFANAATDYIYLYALNNSGTIELAVSGSLLDETVLHTTIAISAAADSGSAIYSSALRANIALRLLGRTKIETGATAGEWDNVPTELFVGDIKLTEALLGGTYEEGTWTPILSDGTNDATSYATRVGFYEKIGRQVSIRAYVKTSDLGSVSGAIRIEGLPYTASADADSYAAVDVSKTSGLAITAGQNLDANIVPNTDYFLIEVWDAVTGTSGLIDTKWTGDGGAAFSATYHVD